MAHFFKTWNWGKGIALTIVLVCGGILFIVYKATTYNYDMVIDNYYEEELKFNDQAKAIENAHLLSKALHISQDSQFVFFEFPPECNHKSIKGTIKLYRPSDAKKDILLPIEFVSGAVMAVPTNKTVKGNYHVIAEWTMDNTEYKIVKNLEVL